MGFHVTMSLLERFGGDCRERMPQRLAELQRTTPRPSTTQRGFASEAGSSTAAVTRVLIDRGTSSGKSKVSDKPGELRFETTERVKA